MLQYITHGEIPSPAQALVTCGIISKAFTETRHCCFYTVRNTCRSEQGDILERIKQEQRDVGRGSGGWTLRDCFRDFIKEMRRTNPVAKGNETDGSSKQLLTP